MTEINNQFANSTIIIFNTTVISFFDIYSYLCCIRFWDKEPVLNVRKLIVLLFAFSHLLTSLLYTVEYSLHEEKKHQIENCKCQSQAESEKINNINLKNEVNMEKKSLEIETAAGQSNTATLAENKSTVEVH